MPLRPLLMPLVLVLGASPRSVRAAAAGAHEALAWRRADAPGADAGPCTLPRLDVGTTRGVAAFVGRHVRGETPVVLTNLRGGEGEGETRAAFKEYLRRVSRRELLADFGEATITLSTANSYSHAKIKKTLRAYVNDALDAAANAPRKVQDARGNETYLWFGDHDDGDQAGQRLRRFIDTYEHAMPPAMRIPGTRFSRDVALSFGIGGVGTGVPWHTHGAGFSECFSGRKRWFFQAPDDPPVWDPDATTAQWLAAALRSERGVTWSECVVQPGEAIYFPSEWYHATLNLDETVHISAFVNGGAAATSARAAAARERGLQKIAQRRATQVTGELR